LIKLVLPTCLGPTSIKTFFGFNELDNFSDNFRGISIPKLYPI